jgi:hypothetical protein
VSDQDAATFSSLLNSGDYHGAAAFAVKAGQITSDGKTQNVVWSLQAGATLFDAGDMKNAIADLDTTEKLAQNNDLDQMHAAFDYRYTTYDGVMTNVYKAMAFLAQGDKDNTRVELNRSEDRQKRAEEYFQKEVAYDSAHNKAAGNPQYANLMQSAQQNQDYASSSSQLSQLAVYAPFENPFATYLAGIFFFAQGDHEKGIDGLKRASAILGPSSPATADLTWAQKTQGSKSSPPQVWVILENGQSATFHEMRLVLPMVTGQSMTLALPALVQNAPAYPMLRVTAAGNVVQTSPAGSFDAVMASEFNRRRPMILGEAVAEVLLKNVGAAAAQKSGNPFAQLVARVAVNVSSADTRSWTALPKEFQAVRLAAPADGHLAFAAADGTQVGEASVPPGRSCIVWVKAQHAGTHPAIQVLPL